MPLSQYNNDQTGFATDDATAKGLGKNLTGTARSTSPKAIKHETNDQPPPHMLQVTTMISTARARVFVPCGVQCVHRKRTIGSDLSGEGRGSGRTKVTLTIEDNARTKVFNAANYFGRDAYSAHAQENMHRNSYTKHNVTNLR